MAKLNMLLLCNHDISICSISIAKTQRFCHQIILIFLAKYAKLCSPVEQIAYLVPQNKKTTTYCGLFGVRGRIRTAGVPLRSHRKPSKYRFFGAISCKKCVFCIILLAFSSFLTVLRSIFYAIFCFSFKKYAKSMPILGLDY